MDKYRRGYPVSRPELRIKPAFKFNWLKLISIITATLFDNAQILQRDGVDTVCPSIILRICDLSTMLKVFDGTQPPRNTAMD